MFDRSTEFVELTRKKSPFLWIESGSNSPKIDPNLTVTNEIFNKIQKITETIKRISRLTGEIKVLQKNSLAEGRREEIMKITEKMEIIDKEIISEATWTRQAFKELRGLDLEDGKICTKIKGVGNNFIGVMEEFERLQEVYGEKCRQQLERQLLVIDPSGKINSNSLTGGNDMICNYNGSGSGSSSPLSHQIQIFRMNCEDSRALREFELESLRLQKSEMQKLEKGLQEIHDLFQDIRGLVQEQGDTIFRVQDFVEEIEVNVKKSVVELEKKNEVEKKKQRRRIWLVGIGVVVLGGLLLIILRELFWS